MAGERGGGRVPRRTRGSGHGATVATRRTYRVHGQIYNRLMFINSSSPQRFLGTEDRATIPAASHNIFARDNIHQCQGGQLEDFAMNSWADEEKATVDLFLKRGRRELEAISPQSDGSFAFTTDLRRNVEYTLEAMLQGERFYSERVRFRFRVPRIPREHDDRREIQVRTTHELNTQGTSWTQVDRETVRATVRGGIQPRLWFAGPAVVLFDTFALDVTPMSQHLGGGHHTFTYNRTRYSVELQHLCLATCSAMLLRYYGKFESDSRDRVVRRVVEAAARWVLQNSRTMNLRSGDGSQITLDTSQRDPSGNRLVRLSNGEWPHNHGVSVSRGAERLLQGAPHGRGQHVGAADDNLATSAQPKLINFLGLGMPVTIADDLRGNWEHGRVCRGVVLKHDGELAKIYVNDPSRPNRRDISTDGSQSDLGWVLLGRTMRHSGVADVLLGSAADRPTSRMRSGLYR